MATDKVPSYPQNVLGCGVDATSPSPLKSRKKGAPVRTPMTKNVIIDNSSPVREEKSSYSISSVQTLKNNFTGSLDLAAVATPLSISIEGEYARDISKELTSTSVKHHTRSIWFKPLGTENDFQDDEFQKHLYHWFIDHIKSCKGIAKGPSMYEEVGKKLSASKNAFKDFIEAAYIFIKTEGITHFVHQIDLGAAKYTLMSKSSKTITKKGGAKINVPSGGSVGGGAESSDSTTTVRSSEQKIGKIGADGEVMVVPGDKESEGVIGYSLLPISYLVQQERMKVVVREAVLKYMDRAKGPFLISGGAKNDLYLRVNEKDEIRATTAKGDASLFVVDKAVSLGEFTVAFYGSQKDIKEKKARVLQYLQTDSRLTGYDEGPLKVGRHRGTSSGAKFILQQFPHNLKKSKRVFLNTWEADLCYVRVAPRAFQRRSYVGLKIDAKLKNQSFGVCKHSKSEDGVDGVYLQFQLQRPDGDEVVRSTVFTGPSGGSDAAGYTEGEDDFEDFADEYDQILDTGDEGFDFD